MSLDPIDLNKRIDSGKFGTKTYAPKAKEALIGWQKLLRERVGVGENSTQKHATSSDSVARAGSNGNRQNTWKRVEWMDNKEPVIVSTVIPVYALEKQ